MSNKRIRWDGYTSYTPSEGDWARDTLNPYSDAKPDKKQLWNEGWEEAKYEAEQEQECNEAEEREFLDKPFFAKLVERVEALEERVADLENI